MAGAGIISMANEAEFADLVEKSSVPTVVDLWATWCQPCIMQGKVLEELAGKHGERVKVVKVNIDELQAIAQRFSVQAIPTLLFFQDGQLSHSHVGIMSLQDLEKRLGL